MLVDRVSGFATIYICISIGRILGAVPATIGIGVGAHSN